MKPVRYPVPVRVVDCAMGEIERFESAPYAAFEAPYAKHLLPGHLPRLAPTGPRLSPYVVVHHVVFAICEGTSAAVGASCDDNRRSAVSLHA
jgi:hypothetical protein